MVREVDKGYNWLQKLWYPKTYEYIPEWLEARATELIEEMKEANSRMDTKVCPFHSNDNIIKKCIKEECVHFTSGGVSAPSLGWWGSELGSVVSPNCKLWSKQ